MKIPKNLVLGPILAHLAQIWGTKFFLKISGSEVTRYHGQLSSCTISEKSNDPMLKKLSDGRTDGWTDGQTDDSDFIGCCPTNVERPIIVTEMFILSMDNNFRFLLWKILLQNSKS